MGGMGGMFSVGTGGFRSIPPTGPPSALLSPNQTRSLDTRLVSLNPPSPQGRAFSPAKGEALQLGDIADTPADPRTRAALKRLALTKAPQAVSQLVLWRLASGLDWPTLERVSKAWANPHEVALAKAFAAEVEATDGALPEAESGVLYAEVVASDPASEPLAAELRKQLKENLVLGLRPKLGVPATPAGPAVSCRVVLGGGEASVVVQSTEVKRGLSWTPMGKFTLALAKEDGAAWKAPEVVDQLAEGLLNRLVRTQVTKGAKVKNKFTYKVRIDNASPLILNGLALTGTAVEKGKGPRVSALAGLNLTPQRSLSLPASAEIVESLGLTEGVRVVAADLSGL